MCLFSASRISHVDVFPVRDAQNTWPGIHLEAPSSHAVHAWPPTALEDHRTLDPGRRKMVCFQPLILLKHFYEEAPENTDELVEERHTSTWH